VDLISVFDQLGCHFWITMGKRGSASCPIQNIQTALRSAFAFALDLTHDFFIFKIKTFAIVLGIGD
jgi:hypothetical protein